MKRLTALLIAVIMLFAAIPVTAEQAAENEITVPGKAVTGVKEACECEITFDGSKASVYGGSVKTTDSGITITEAGSYLLKGSYEGNVTIDVSKEKKVELCLNGVYIMGMINVVSAPKNVTVNACADSVNIIVYSAAATETDSAAIYAKDDLKFTGSGALYVVSENNRGIHSSDDITIKDISLYVISGGNGIQGKDSVQITGGSVYVKSGADGIKSTNTEDEGKGCIVISGGSVTVISQEDGLQADNSLTIDGGEISITTGGGYTASTKVHTDDFGWGGGGKGGFGGSRGGSAQTASTEKTTSQKAVKAASEITVNGGSIYIDSCDDALHSDKNLTVNGGDIVIYAGDDGLHANSVLTINAGNVNVLSSYEGLEGTVININGGEIRVVSSDDGINAAGDDTDAVSAQTASSTQSSGRGGWGQSSGTGELNITGGYVVINALGDGMDTNNAAYMSGGTLIVYGPVSNYNGALDYERTFVWTGGTIIASGSKGMAQSVTASGSGAVIAFSLSMKADTLLTIADSNGNEVLSFTSPKEYASLVFASDALTSGKSYSIYTGGTHTGTAVDGIYTSGKAENASLAGSMTAK